MTPKIINKQELTYTMVLFMQYSLLSITVHTCHQTTWPGLKTNLKWNPNALFNISLSIYNKTQALTINGTTYYSTDNHYKNGFVGLSYNRIKDINFLNFYSHDNDKLHLREFKDYFKYVEDGGNLFVFNTNGYGEIAKYLLNTSVIPSFKPNQIPYQMFHDLITTNNMNKLINHSKEPFKDKNQKRIINNISNSDFYKENTRKLNISLPNSNSSVYLIKKHLGKGILTYIDIYPSLLKLFENKLSYKDLSYIFDNVSKILSLDNMDYHTTNFKGPSFFQQIIGNGTIKINTNSLIFLNDFIRTIWIKQGNNIHGITNLTKLDISNYSSVKILDNGDRFSIDNGRGFYSNITLFGKSTSNNSFFLGNATLQGISDDKTFKINNVSSISIKGQPLVFYVRQPNINIAGDILLNKYYKEHFVNSDQYRIINGTISFNAYMSDFYTLIHNLSITGYMDMFPPLHSVNELNFLNYHLVFFQYIINTIICMGFTAFSNCSRRHRRVCGLRAAAAPRCGTAVSGAASPGRTRTPPRTGVADSLSTNRFPRRRPAPSLRRRSAR